MTDTTDRPAHEYAILRAAQDRARGGMHPIPTRSLLAAAAALLKTMWSAGQQHGVEPGDWDTLYGGLAPLALAAQVAAHNRRSAAVDVDPMEALTDVVAAAGRHPDGPLEVAEGPVRVRDETAYIVFARRAGTPPWGPRGDAPLALGLSRPHDGRDPATIAWEWMLMPDIGARTSDIATIEAPPPGPAAAADVAELLRQVLDGELRIWR